MFQLYFLSKFSDFGFLVLRIVVGGSFIMHGFPKISGGPEKWAILAGHAGITTMPTVAGFIAAFAEFAGGICLILGFLTRPMCILLFATMLGAINYHVNKGDGFSGYSHALELAGVFLGLAFVGPGRYSIDKA